MNLSTALYRASGVISCPFDGYTDPALGRHEGIDFQKAFQAPVYALVDGTITRVAEGAPGSASSDLSTIAIYYAAADRTVIYLHTAPLSSLSAGQTIKRNQQIAIESHRGASSNHTHVEVRVGRQTYASVSHDDTLVNPDPTAFWNARGYNVR